LVRRIFLILDDDEFSRLMARKGELTWKEFLVDSHLSELETENKPKKPSKTMVIVNGGNMGEEVSKTLKARFGDKVRVQIQSS